MRRPSRRPPGSDHRRTRLVGRSALERASGCATSPPEKNAPSPAPATDPVVLMDDTRPLRLPCCTRHVCTAPLTRSGPPRVRPSGRFHGTPRTPRTSGADATPVVGAAARGPTTSAHPAPFAPPCSMPSPRTPAAWRCRAADVLHVAALHETVVPCRALRGGQGVVRLRQRPRPCDSGEVSDSAPKSSAALPPLPRQLPPIRAPQAVRDLLVRQVEHFVAEDLGASGSVGAAVLPSAARGHPAAGA